MAALSPEAQSRAQEAGRKARVHLGSGHLSGEVRTGCGCVSRLLTQLGYNVLDHEGLPGAGGKDVFPGLEDELG